MSQQNNFQQPGFEHFIQTWWQNLHFGTKMILGLSMFFGIIDAFTELSFEIFSNSPDTTFPFQFQRLIFAQYVHYYTLDLLLAIICLFGKFKEFETKLGTVVFLIIILLLGFSNQLLCVLLQFGFSFIYEPFYTTFAYGLWNFMVFFIVQECLMNPGGQSQFLIFPMQIRNKFYPCFFIIFFTLVQQSLTFITSGIIAMIYFLFQEKLLQYQTSTIERYEKGLLFKWFHERHDFKRVSNYNDQLEPSVDARELPYVETPPAKLSMDGSAPFPPSLLMSELQMDLKQKEKTQDQPQPEQEESKQQGKYEQP